MIAARSWGGGLLLSLFCLGFAPDESTSWKESSAKLYREGRFPEALAVLERRLEASPDDREAMLLAAACNLRIKRYGEAVLRFEAALRDGAVAGREEAFVFLGQALSHLGRFDEAREAFGRALESRPEEGRAIVGMGYCFLREGDLEEAERLLRLGTGSSPPAPEAHRWLGDLLLERRRLPEAVSTLEKARELEPHAEEVSHKLMLAYRLAGRTDESDLELRRFQELKAEGEILRALEDRLGSNAEDRETLTRLAALREQRREEGEALTLLFRLHALEPRATEYALRIGRLYREIGRPEKALEFLDQWLAGPGEDAPAGLALREEIRRGLPKRPEASSP